MVRGEQSSPAPTRLGSDARWPAESGCGLRFFAFAFGHAEARPDLFESAQLDLAHTLARKGQAQGDLFQGHAP